MVRRLAGHMVLAGSSGAGNPAEKPYFVKAMDQALWIVNVFRNEDGAGTFSVTTSDLSGRLDRPQQTPLTERTMADRAALGILGFIFGGVTALVILIAVFVVHSHVNAIAAIEQSASTVSPSLSVRR
jgi:hypothetical protein